MIWTDLPTMTSIRDDGAKVGAFPGPDGCMEWWAYPPGYKPRGYEGPEPQGPFRTSAEAKASLSALLPFVEEAS